MFDQPIDKLTTVQYLDIACCGVFAKFVTDIGRSDQPTLSRVVYTEGIQLIYPMFARAAFVMLNLDE